MAATKLRDAYLIMCHGQYELLKILLKLLDNEENDIYLHVDSKWNNFSYDDCEKQLKNSRIFFVDRKNVQWGGMSQIKTELSLLEEAVKEKHRYYHLLSGVDLPIKSYDQIDEFFEANYGTEYIDISDVSKENYYDRVKYYYFFQEYIGRNRGCLCYALRKVQELLLFLQKKLNIERNLGDLQYYKGANWFSITHNMAQYVVNQKEWINKKFRYTFCADEIFLQTIAMNSKYVDRIAKNSCRYIDWDRGTPYTFKETDYVELISNENLFARKFSMEADCNIVKKIYEYVSNKQ